MAHFITGLYYFTGFQIFLIIVTGFAVGQALVSIYDLIQAIRHHQPIKPKIYILLPWLIVSIILLLSPVYSSNLGSAWMLIFAVIEIIAAILTRKIFSRHQQLQTNDEQLNTEASPSDNDFTNDYYYDGERYEYNPGVSQDIKSEDDQTGVSDEPKESQEAAVSQPVQSQEPASAASAVSQPASSASQAQSTVSQPASSALQAQSAASSAVSTASQPVSQAAKSDEDDMDKLFDYNENTDAELAEEAKERREKVESDQAKIAKRLSEMEANRDKAN